MNFRKAQATLLPSEQLKALGWMPLEISVRAGKIDPGHRVSAATVDSLIDGGYAQLDPQGPLFVRGPSDIAPFDELHRIVITPAGAKALAAFDLVFDREAAVLDRWYRLEDRRVNAVRLALCARAVAANSRRVSATAKLHARAAAPLTIAA